MGITWGFLQATGYPVFMEKLAATCATAVESRVQIDGRIVTSRGPGTTIEFSITLIEQLFGKEKADEVSSIMVCFVSASFISTLPFSNLEMDRDRSEQHNNCAMVFKLVLSSNLRLICSSFEISWFVLTLVRSLLLPSLTKRTGHSKIPHRYIISVWWSNGTCFVVKLLSFFINNGF